MAADPQRSRPQGRNSVQHSCDLEVDINDEHTFVLSKKPLLVFSGKISKLLSNSRATRRNGGGFRRHKISLESFPGGFKAFEICAVFCYSGGKQPPLTHSNLAVLRAAAEELEMFGEYVPGNLIPKAEDFLATAGSWSWPELLEALRGCEPVLEQSEKVWVPQRIAATTAEYIHSQTIPDDSSEGSGGDSCSGSSDAWSSSESNWWFREVARLNIYLVERIVGALTNRHVDHRYLARFLLYYFKTSLRALGCTLLVSRPDPSKNNSNKSGEENAAGVEFQKRAQREVLDTIVGRLVQLDDGSLSPRSLFAMLRMAVGLEASKQCRGRIERMIGQQLQWVSLDSVLVSSTSSTRSWGSVYDVDLMLRLTWYFVKAHVAAGMCSLGQVALSTVARLLDRYLIQVAPDPHLHPSKFLRLARSLPATARIADDDLYRAVDLYLETHKMVGKSDVEALCGLVNYQQLSVEACAHITHNPRFPSPLAVRALLAQRELMGRRKGSNSGAAASNKNNTSGGSNNRSGRSCKVEEGEEASSVVVTTHHVREVVEPNNANIILAQNEELRAGLSQMAAKVSSLEKMCKSMRTEVVDTVRGKRLIC